LGKSGQLEFIEVLQESWQARIILMELASARGPMEFEILLLRFSEQS
jgi:hypothetical protein